MFLCQLSLRLFYKNVPHSVDVIKRWPACIEFVQKWPTSIKAELVICPRLTYKWQPICPSFPVTYAKEMKLAGEILLASSIFRLVFIIISYSLGYWIRERTENFPNSNKRADGISGHGGKLKNDILHNLSIFFLN